jgi:hypothetical protein
MFQILIELSTEPLANKLVEIKANDLTESVCPIKVFNTIGKNKIEV